MFDRIIQFSLSHRLLVIFACIVLSGAGIYVMGTLPCGCFPGNLRLLKSSFRPKHRACLRKMWNCS